MGVSSFEWWPLYWGLNKNKHASSYNSRKLLSFIPGHCLPISLALKGTSVFPWFLQSIPFLIFLYTYVWVIVVVMYACMHVCVSLRMSKCVWVWVCTCDGQRTTSGNLFSSSTLWVTGVEHRSSGLAASSFSHWVILLAQRCCCCCYFFLRQGLAM